MGNAILTLFGNGAVAMFPQPGPRLVVPALIVQVPLNVVAQCRLAGDSGRNATDAIHTTLTSAWRNWCLLGITVSCEMGME